MIDLLLQLVQYQNYIFIGMGVLVVLALAVLWQARSYLSRTPFGLEREQALRRQNAAVGLLTVMVLLAMGLYLTDQFVLPGILVPSVTPTPTPLPTPTPSPIAVQTGIVVDSSGCDNPDATLIAPKAGDLIAGAFEVVGTANISNLAFYKFEISGAGTGGQWLSLGVGTERRVEAVLGRFDASAREPGEYAFRLMVLDNAGNFPPPCVIPITLVGTASGPSE
jgi:hypothetical protein